MIVIRLFPFVVALCISSWYICRSCVFGLAIFGINVPSKTRDMVVRGVPLGVLALTILKLLF